jgi:hypothetical protein
MAKKERNKITQSDEKIIDAIASSSGGSATKTAVAVLGYPMPKLTPTLATPEVARQIKAGLVRRLIAESVPAAITLLEQEVKLGLHRQGDKDRKNVDKEPESAGTGALDAAKTLANLAGMQAAGESLAIEKDPGEMSGAELEEALRKAKDVELELARRSAIIVEGSVSAPSDAPVDSQATDSKDNLFS